MEAELALKVLDRIIWVEKKLDVAVRALEYIHTADYRGNPSPDSVVAGLALAEIERLGK